MRATDADTNFRSRLRRQGIDLDDTAPQQGFDALLDFYREVRADDVVLEDSGDMLLYQWGTYDWGEGKHFELNLTRQLIVEPGGDDNIWQLSLTYHFDATDDLESPRAHLEHAVRDAGVARRLNRSTTPQVIPPTATSTAMTRIMIRCAMVPIMAGFASR
jgi:hypothetical protein